jgi:hypothetical protein
LERLELDDATLAMLELVAGALEERIELAATLLARTEDFDELEAG